MNDLEQKIGSFLSLFTLIMNLLPVYAPSAHALEASPAVVGDVLPVWFETHNDLALRGDSAASPGTFILPNWFSIHFDNDAAISPAVRSEAVLYDTLPPQPAASLLPDWFATAPRSTAWSAHHHTIHENDVTVSGPDEIDNCDTITFIITATNDSVTTTNVIITNAMPTGFTPPQRVFNIPSVGPNQVVVRNAVFDADCSAVSGQNETTVHQDGYGDFTIYTDYAVNPGAITLRKVPSVIPAAVGDVVTWTVIVENTGYGRVDNVVVTDTLGTGLTFVGGSLGANYSSMDIGDVQTFDVSVRVDACIDLDNDAVATWGCPGETCQTHDVQASVDLQLNAPYLEYTLPTFDVDYCAGSGVFTIPVINSGLGTAHNVVLATNMGPFSITALSPGAVYTPGVGFGLPDITGTTGPPTEYNLVCELHADDICNIDPSGDTFNFQLEFDDDCGNPYVLPVKQQNWSLGGDVPSLSISKGNVPIEIYLGEIVSPTITVDAENVDFGPIIVTDTVPPGWSVLITDGGNVFTVGPQIYITWTVSGVTTTILSPVIQSPISDTEGCAYCGAAAINTVEVRATDCQTCTHTATDSTTTQIQCEDILGSHKQVSPLAAETCTSFVYTSTYVFASSFTVTPTWQGLVFTDTLLNQTYPGGSAGIQVSNGSSCAATFSETVVNGELVLTNISPTCGVNLPGATMVITFSSEITAPGGCDDLTFFDWSYLNLGVTGNGYCADDGILEEGVFVTVDAPQMALGIQGDPANVEPCAEYPITLTLTLLPGAPAYDVALRFDTTDYAVVQVLGFGGPTPYFTHTGPLSYTWFYSDDFTTITTATVYLFVQRRCDATGPIDAEAWYGGLCEDNEEYFEEEECYINVGVHPPDLWPSLIIAKYPEIIYATGDFVTWTLTLINSGPGTAHDIVLTDTLGSGLQYYTSTITTTRGSVAGVVAVESGGVVTWTLEEVPSGAQMTIKFVAEIVSCEDLTNNFRGAQSCQDQVCIPAGPMASEVVLPDTVLLNTNQSISPIESCYTRTVTVTVRNAGLTSVYSATMSETLPAGLIFIPGTVRYNFNGASFVAGPDPVINLPVHSWGPSSGMGLGALLQRLEPLDTIYLLFDVYADCPFESGVIVIETSYLDVCGDPYRTAASSYLMEAAEPDLNLTKEGRNLSTGEPWTDLVNAEPGETVLWRLVVTAEPGGGIAERVILTDALPVNVTLVGASPAPVTTTPVISWDVGLMAPGDVFTAYITATVNTSDCMAIDQPNTARVYWFCPPSPPYLPTGCTGEAVVQSAMLRTRPVFPDTQLDLTPNSLHLCQDVLTITLDNQGTPAYTTTLTATLPFGMVYSETLSIISTPPDVAPTPGDNPAVWSWNTISLPTGLTTIAIRVRNAVVTTDCLSWSGPVRLDLIYNDASACFSTPAYTATRTIPLTLLEPLLTVLKTPTTQFADVGDVVTWTVTVQNTGLGDAPNVVVTDTLGSGFSSWGATDGSDADETNSPLIVGNTIVWTPPVNIAAGDTWTAVVTATVAEGGDQSNDVYVSGHCAIGCQYADSSDTAYVSVMEQFGKWPNVQTATIGSLTVFTFSTFLADVDAVYEDLTLTDTLPTGLGYVSSWFSATYDIDGNQGGPGTVISPTPTLAPVPPASGDVIWALGDLSGTLRINGFITAVIQDIPANQAGDTLVNDLRMTYTDDGQPYVYTDTADVNIVEPSLTLVKASDPPTSSTVGAGDLVTYTIVITNWSAPYASPAYRLYITDTLPAHVTLLSPLPLSLDIDGTPLIAPADYISTNNGSELTFDFTDALSLPTGSVLTLVYYGQVDADVPAGEDQINTVQVSWSAFDTAGSGERDYFLTDSANVHAGYPTLPLAKSAAPGIVDVGDRITYTIRVTNTGIVSATGVVITDVIPAYTTFIAATDPHTGPVPGPAAGSIITWPLGILDIDETNVVTMIVQVVGPIPAGTVLANSAWITSNEGISDTDTVTTPLYAALGDYVWLDTDGDGTQDESGTGLDGVTVTLYVDVDGDGVSEPGADDGAPISTTQTADLGSGSGYYTFTRLIPGDYFVVFSPPPTYTITRRDQGADTTDSDADRATGIAIVTTLESAERDPTWDAGLYIPASLGDFVWYDNDADGIQNVGEAGVPGVTVNLYDGTSTLTGTTTTDISGTYIFTDLIPGDYFVEFIRPADYVSSPQDTGADDTVDSDADTTTGRTIFTALESDEHDMTWDAGLYRLDYGDAPEPTYPTLYASNGARHIILPTGNPTLGSIVDAETDGQPSAGADGDDTLDGSDDEDGVAFLTPLAPGKVATLTVSAAVTGSDGYLNAWIDFNTANDWSDAGEQIASNVFITAGESVTIAFTVPSTATQGNTFARFRFSSQTGLTPTGRAPDGEIEDYMVSTLEMDYGDLPDVYGTRFGSNGPHHVITSTNPTLGATVDAETDGQPTATADGDDLNGIPDDEDGVRLDSPLLPGAVAALTITGTNVTGAVLNAWMDFDGDGSLTGPGEQIFTDTVLVAGPNVLALSVPLVVFSDTINARFRYGTQPGLGPNGYAPDGEIEDHQFAPTPMDLGDLPEGPYPTTLSVDGARHAILPVNNPTLGATVDAENDGQPNVTATGDDSDGSDDEDGVRLDSPLVPGQVATLTITGTNVTGAILNAWMDFDGDGSLTGPGEQIFADRTLVAGPNVLTLSVPLAVLNDTINARFRYGTETGLIPTGPAVNGEIEDHQFAPTPMDLGDLPEGPYPTTLSVDGARHVILAVNNPALGATVDAETDGQPTATADGDDSDGSDDEDGVRLDSPLVPGQVATLTITGTNVTFAVLNAWMDFDGDGSMTGPGEQIFTDTALVAGPNVLTLSVPLVVLNDTINARFRYGTQTGLTPTGPAVDGEIEDHQFTSTPLEFGDLPQGPYPTTLAADGARHIVDGATYLGSVIDAESDGQPTFAADGDDTAGVPDDEDGVTFLTPLMRAQPAQTQVVAASDGYLNAWIDFDYDGALDVVNVTAIDGAPVATTMNDVFLSAGVHTFTISVPDVAIGSSVYSRFRFTSFDSAGTLSDTGLAADGEVEDYVLLSLGNLVWLDMGAGGGIVDDGAVNGTEPGIAGVTVELYQSGQTPGVDTPITATTTNAAGYYTFTGLTPGVYVAHIPASQFGASQPLEGLLSSTGNGISDADVDHDTDENGIDDTNPALNGISADSVTLAVGDEPTSEDGDANSNLTIDFGFVVAAAIGDYIWFDADADGVQDAGEAGVPGVTVTLYTTAGVPVSTTTTNANGYYSFTNLSPGGYYLVFIPPADYVLTLQDQGADDAVDSDADQTTGQTIPTTLEPGEYDQTWDAGLYLQPDLFINKTVSVGRAVANMPITFSIYISNSGQVTFDPLALIDTLPSPDFNYVAGSGTPTPDTVAGTALFWNNLGPLAPDTDLIVTFAVTVTPGITGTYVNVATATGTTPITIITDTDDALVVLEDPSVAIAKNIAAPGAVDGIITFSIHITNTGPSVIDILPLLDYFGGDIAYVGGIPPADSVDNVAGVLVWNDLTTFFGNMAPDQTFVVQTVFSIIASGPTFTATNRAVVTDGIDIYDNPANDDEDTVVIINEPTAVDLLYLRASGHENGVLVEWATLYEIESYGFWLYRASLDQFPLALQIAFLPSQGGMSGAEYAYVDKEVEIGQGYWYWLVEVDNSGLETRYGPVTATTGAPDASWLQVYLPIVIKK